MNDVSLEEYFKSQSIIPTVTAVEYIRVTHPHISDSTARGYVSEMVYEGLLKRVGKGKYVLGSSKDYKPNLIDDVISLNTKLKKNYPYLDVCIWHTSQLNEFLQHQLIRHLMLIEVAQDAVETVFEFIKNEGCVVLSNPSADVMEKYMANEGDTCIIKSLVTETPLFEIDNINTATLEKILVDVYCDKDIFNSVQGNEMIALFDNAMDKYTINQDRLLRYAARRGKRSDIKKLIMRIDDE